MVLCPDSPPSILPNCEVRPGYEAIKDSARSVCGSVADNHVKKARYGSPVCIAGLAVLRLWPCCQATTVVLQYFACTLLLRSLQVLTTSRSQQLLMGVALSGCG